MASDNEKRDNLEATIRLYRELNDEIEKEKKSKRGLHSAEKQLSLLREEAANNQRIINEYYKNADVLLDEQKDDLKEILSRQREIVEEEKMLDEAIELAKDMLAKSPLGLRMTKDAINLTMDSPSLETMIRLDNRGQIVCTASKDLMEAFQAFFEKRKPNYPLR